MSAFSFSTRVGIEDEFRVEKRKKDTIYGVMHQSVAHARLVNIPGFRVGDLERAILPVPVGSGSERSMQCEDIVRQLRREKSDILAARFVSDEFSPGRKQVFDRDDRIEDMANFRSSSRSHSASILSRVKEGYLIWVNILPHMPKGARYMIGSRIENKFLDLLELSYVAYYTEREKKSKRIDECVLVLDTLKFLISVSWEGKFVSNKQFEDISLKLVEIGRMFGGWRKSLDNPGKKNRDQ